VVGDRTYVVLALIRQSAGSREDLHDTDHTKEEEDHPDDLVAFENVAYLFVHILFI
jgi:hypothetical protein